MQGMVDLVLTGAYTGISAFGCFAIKIDIPGADAGSSSGNASGSLIKWEWDCYDPKYATQVDTMMPAHHRIRTRDGRKVAEVTYAVMSNAPEATVQVVLRLKDGRSPGIHGKITAFIVAFREGSVLFSRTRETAEPCSKLQVLPLARSVVAVPCGLVLSVVVDLQIETFHNQGVRHLDATLSFTEAISTQKHQIDGGGDEVEVNITWKPESIRPHQGPSRQDQVCTICFHQTLIN